MSSKKLSQNSVNFTQFESKLMNTIVALCTKRTPFENLDEFLQSVDAIRIRISVADQFSLATSLWNVYVQVSETQPPGVLFDFGVVFSALFASVKSNSPELAQNAISAVLFIVEQVGFSASVVSRRLGTLLTNATSISEQFRLQSLLRLNSTLSVSSMVHELFDKYATQVVELLKDGAPLPMELVDLIVSLMETSSLLLKIPVLIFLQNQVCLSALNKNPGIEVLKLLNALLEHNHEGVPLPIEVAISVFQRGYFSYQNEAKFREVLARGRAICQMITRPRRVANCANLPINGKTMCNDDAMTTSNNGSTSLDQLKTVEKAGKKTDSIRHENSATISNAMDSMNECNDDNNDEEDATDEEECDNIEECYEDGVTFPEDIITLDDDDDDRHEDEEEIIAETGNKIGAKFTKTEKDFALKTVDELLMDFTDE